MHQTSYVTEHLVRDRIATLRTEAERERLARQPAQPRDRARRRLVGQQLRRAGASVLRRAAGASPAAT